MFSFQRHVPDFSPQVWSWLIWARPTWMAVLTAWLVFSSTKAVATWTAPCSAAAVVLNRQEKEWKLHLILLRWMLNDALHYFQLTYLYFTRQHWLVTSTGWQGWKSLPGKYQNTILSGSSDSTKKKHFFESDTVGEINCYLQLSWRIGYLYMVRRTHSSRKWWKVLHWKCHEKLFDVFWHLDNISQTQQHFFEKGIFAISCYLQCPRGNGYVVRRIHSSRNLWKVLQWRGHENRFHCLLWPFNKL